MPTREPRGTSLKHLGADQLSVHPAQKQAVPRALDEPQCSDEGITHDPTFADAQRVRLDRGAWVDLSRGWVSGHESLFEAVLAAADWPVWTRPMFVKGVEQPRLSVSWSRSALPSGLEPIKAMSASLSARYGVPLTRESAPSRSSHSAIPGRSGFVHAGEGAASAGPWAAATSR